MKRLYIIIGVLVLAAIRCLAFIPSNAGTGGSPFEFRAICSPYNVNPELFDIEGTHSIDNDWSLWGHNIWKVLGKNPPEEVYATIDGKKDHTQYCFSSPKLYGILRKWIADQWGTHGGRFSVIPADNKKVCQCERCLKAGNTATSATPAVAAFATKIAKEFPGHKFFMASYHSTTLAPTQQLPKNVGVLMSAIDIPMRMIFQENKGFKKFDGLLKDWKKVTSLIYVWEYDRNFDDYLSPFPTLLPLQQRLKYYRSQGIKGIFINGSDDAYASFDDMQTYVIAQLLLNPDADVEKLVRKFYAKFYPMSGKMIADYYLSLEKKVQETNHILPFYGTIQEEIESYLDPQQFVSFWQALDKEKKSTTGKERQRLNAMLTALAYTRLMLNPSPEEKAEMVAILKEHASVMRPGTKNDPFLMRYKEPESGTIDSFLDKIK